MNEYIGRGLARRPVLADRLVLADRHLHAEAAAVRQAPGAGDRRLGIVRLLLAGRQDPRQVAVVVVADRVGVRVAWVAGQHARHQVRLVQPCASSAASASRVNQVCATRAAATSARA